MKLTVYKVKRIVEKNNVLDYGNGNGMPRCKEFRVYTEDGNELLIQLFSDDHVVTEMGETEVIHIGEER